MEISLEAFNSWLNATNLPSSDDMDLLFHCWRLTTCDSCLSTDYPCSWCSISSTCVPNTIFKFPFQILAPIKTESICPLAWRERWELRAKPFSCRCSTMTLMSTVIAVLSTLVALSVIQILIVLLRWGIRRFKKRQPGWWKVHEWRPSLPFVGRKRKQEEGRSNEQDAERQPLLDT